MLLASPIFLLALVPWTGLVLWLLLGKRRRVNVSFLELWKGPVSGPTARRRIGMPPIALAAILAALLLAIVAAARPGIRTATAKQVPVVIVVDRGITMSAGKPARFAALAEELKPAIRDEFGAGEVQVVLVPGGEVLTFVGTEWANAVKSVPGTAIDTSGMVDVAVRQQLELNSASPIVVQSDQKVNVANERLVQVAPQLPSKNISIAHVAARISPVGQVMVGVRNQSDEKRTVIRVMSDDRQSARQEVELPAKGQVRDYFLPIEPAAKVIRVEIEAADDFAADNLAFLVRHGSWPAIEAHTPVFAELQRLIEKYSKLRLPTAESKRVAMVAQDQAGGGAQVILAKPASPANGQLSVVDHPVTRALEKADWTAMARDGVSEPAGEGWRSVLRIGEKTAIAVREAPSRQIWMGLDTRRMANTPEFVMLWSNIFDWVGEGSEEFVARITGDLEPAWQAIEGQPAGLKSGWWPGIYRRSDGALLAINAPDVGVPLSTVSDWKSKISELARQHRQINGIRPLTVPLILAALALMLLAAITWRGGLRKIQQRQQPQRGQDARVTV